ncbi:hypothetical protein M0R04_03985 [Candidatus Dojkabacteria bacterium]|jgi:hypothetical protein|nr:hypothetical protein [Candidatus Dojkabacteria bacterium]
MQSIRRDLTSTLEQNLQKYLPVGEQILHTIDVIPLDTRVANFLSPKLYISKSKLFFVFDEEMDIYDLNSLEISLIGQPPKFDIVPLFLESTFVYSYENRSQLAKFQAKEELTRLSINTIGEVPRYFLVRSNGRSAKSIKTWALMQLTTNIKMGNTDNSQLLEILAGYFSQFNTKTAIYFIASFLIYIVLKLLSSLLPKLVGTIFDVFFGIILVLVAYWAYISVARNLKRYKNTYFTYYQPN